MEIFLQWCGEVQAIYKPVRAVEFDFDIKYQNRTCCIITLLCACVVQCTVSVGTHTTESTVFYAYTQYFSTLTILDMK